LQEDNDMLYVFDSAGRIVRRYRQCIADTHRYCTQCGGRTGRLRSGSQEITSTV